MSSEDNFNIKDVSEIISKDFSDHSSGSLIPAAEFNSVEEFRNYLIIKLADLLDNRYDLLINTLYRIDVSEEKLNTLFTSTQREFIPEALADLIIERQLQKIELRKKYRSGDLFEE